jgi:CheY-like chemotaxis protein
MTELNGTRICSILVAEDDEDDFYCFNMAISSLSGLFQLLHTSDGIRFSSLIQTAVNPDVIFLDINLPYKNGISCLKELRSKEDYDSVKIVMYSTSCSSREIDSCYSLGADFFLVKPSSFSSLQRQLKELFQNDYFVKNQKPPREAFVFNSPQLNTHEWNCGLNLPFS